MKIGPYQLQNNLILAPMAGITDRPFRNLCKRYGAGPSATAAGDGAGGGYRFMYGRGGEVEEERLA